MKNKFALCFRPVDIEKEEKDRDRNHIDDHLDSKGSRRSFSFSDINQNPSSRHDLRRRNSSSRKTLSSALKTLFRSSSPKVVPKGIGAQEGDHMGIEKNKGKEANYNSFSNSCSSSSSTSHVTSPSSSTSSSMNSLETNNINEISLKRSMLARSNSTSIYQNKKPKTTIAKDNKALKSSPDQEGFVFYLVILALVFYLLFGLVYAIMLTSLSLYFIGRHHRREKWPVNAVKLAELRKSRRKIMLHGV